MKKGYQNSTLFVCTILWPCTIKEYLEGTVLVPFSSEVTLRNSLLDLLTLGHFTLAQPGARLGF